MKTDRRKPRTRPLMALGALLFLIALGLGSLPLAAARVRHGAPGSSCARPVTVTLHAGQQYAYYHQEAIIRDEPRYLVKGLARVVSWTGFGESDVICRARIQRSDGSWVGPSRLVPYPTPTPTGGEYFVITNAKTHFRQVMVSFAKSPVPKGASCNYPMRSIAGFSEAQDPSASYRVDVPRRGMDEIEVKIHNPQIVICRITAEELAQFDPGHGSPYERLRDIPISIGEHGGLSTPIQRSTTPQPTHIFRVKVYSRWLHLPKPPRPHGCSLETRTVGNGQIGDTKDFSLKLEVIGKPTAPPYTMAVLVTVHNPRIIICRAALFGLEAIESGGKVTSYKEVSYPLSIGAHGGLSSKVTFPPNVYAPTAQVFARLK